MRQSLPSRRLLLFAVSLPLWLPSPAWAQSAGPTLGVVVMHGKGGSPHRHVNELAGALVAQGYQVANLEMPWSAKREYDASVDAAEKEVELAIAALRSQGATKIVVAGHSQGGLFALYFASRHAVDGVVLIAPGGDPSSNIPREKLADAVQHARTLIADGKGHEKATLADYESAKGTTPVVTTPTIYLSWFDPGNALGLMQSAKRLSPATPVLYVAPRNDYPALLKINPSLYAALPRHAKTQYYEPSVTHLKAPTASIPAILEWTQALSKEP